jgi:DNA-binding beta-propeller fold protein YncE
MNRLGRGDPFSDQVTSVGIYGGSVQGIFHGPQPQPGTPQPPTPFCAYTSRQQIGHFLYVLDRQRRQVLIVNSNRMQVLETIKLSDPYDMAVSPNLRRLAVTNFAPGTVTFVDTDPQSPTFHTIVGETRVGDGPTQCAWQPQGEDLLVLNSTGSSMSIIGGADLKLRKTVTGQLNRPIDVGVTSRQMGFGFATGTYFAYVLNRDGSVAVFESGPDGTNGIGFDDFVGVPEQATFRNGRRLMSDTTVQASAIWVGHTDETGLGQVSHLELTSSQVGPIPINAGAGGFILPPTFRQREWTITGRIGGRTASTPIKDTLSGNSPIDMTFDDIFNNGALTDQQSNQISNLIYADHSGKSDAKVGAMATIPRFLFVAMGDTGKIDIMELDTGKRIKTIDCPGVKVLSGYWRQ